MPYSKHKCLWMTVDPVHIGTGGYRLGRVDLSITREPGTNLPKIPGTSLNGAARHYAAMSQGKPQCAGQGGHCTETNCPVCYTFGSLDTKVEDETKSFAGTANIFDAHLLFFPVSSLLGPVWVTCADALKQAGWKTGANVENGEDKIAVPQTMQPPDNKLNLGWLYLDVASHDFAITEGSPADNVCTEWETIKPRIVLVSNKLFGQIVNANLEVRTSVSIDPLTGAAEGGALFTYEALPRACWLVSEVVIDDYREEEIDPAPKAIVKKGFKMIEDLGVGGMGTRGFGRMRLLQMED